MEIINYEILEDGTLSIKTGEIGDSNHMSADKLLEEFENLLGGEVIKEKLPDKHRHNFAGKKALAK